MKIGLYKNNKRAKVGDMMECPVCHTKFIKKQYSQAFCCIHCKDKFHNKHDGDRHSVYKYREYYVPNSVREQAVDDEICGPDLYDEGEFGCHE